MHEARLREFIQAMLDKTRTGKLSWEEGSTPHSLNLFFPDATVVLESPSPFSFGQSRTTRLPRVLLTVLNDKGQAVLSTNDAVLFDADEKPAAKTLVELLEVVQYRTRRGDELMDHLLKALRGTEVAG